MPTDVSPTLFWLALGLTVLGALLTLAATALLLVRALSERTTVERRIAAGKRINEDRAAARDKAYQASKPPLLSHEDTGQSASIEEENRAVARNLEQINAELDEQFLRELGRAPNEGSSWGDLMVLPELMAKRVIEDQLTELRLPAFLVALGVVISTAGSVVSLWV